MAYAKNELWLSSKEPGFDADNRSILTNIEKSTKQTPKELATSRKLPAALGYLWSWFVEVYGGTPLTYTELAAWAGLRQIELEPHEAHLLTQLSRLSHG